MNQIIDLAASHWTTFGQHNKAKITLFVKAAKPQPTKEISANAAGWKK